MKTELEKLRVRWIEGQQREIERKIAQLPTPKQRQQLREKEQKTYNGRKEKFDANFEDARKTASWKPYDYKTQPPMIRLPSVPQPSVLTLTNRPVTSHDT